LLKRANLFDDWTYYCTDFFGWVGGGGDPPLGSPLRAVERPRLVGFPPLHHITPLLRAATICRSGQLRCPILRTATQTNDGALHARADRGVEPIALLQGPTMVAIPPYRYADRPELPLVSDSSLPNS
jgi:hypothetical protein